MTLTSCSVVGTTRFRNFSLDEIVLYFAQFRCGQLLGEVLQTTGNRSCQLHTPTACRLFERPRIFFSRQRSRHNKTRQQSSCIPCCSKRGQTGFTRQIIRKRKHAHGPWNGNTTKRTTRQRKKNLMASAEHNSTDFAQLRQRKTNKGSQASCWKRRLFKLPCTYLYDLFDESFVSAHFCLLEGRDFVTKPRYQNEFCPLAQLIASLNSCENVKSIGLCKPDGNRPVNSTEAQ